MTQTKKQLDDLFGSVAKDTPALERDKLHALLEKKTSGKLDIGSMQTSNTKLKKGIITMTISAILFTALFFFLSNNHIAPKKMIGNSQYSTPIPNINEKIIEAKEPLSTVNSKKGEKPSTFIDSALRSLNFSRTDLSCITPIEITPAEMQKLGILSGENGEIIFYHSFGAKVGFPMYEASKPYRDFESDERAKQIDNLNLFPSYATDSKGNLVMAYTFAKTQSSLTQGVRLPEFEAKYLQNILNNYHRLQSHWSHQIKVDSTVTPWLITNHYHIKMGIMSADTDLTHPYKGEKINDSQIHDISEKLAAKDSLYKMQFGGEVGLREKFQFPTDYSMMTSEERIIRDTLDNIEKRKGNNIKDMLMSQSWYLRSLEDLPRYSDSLKLKIEQLSLRISFQYETINHKEEEEKFANICSLIPIKVRESTGMKADGKVDNGLIFWYEPNKELFTALSSLRQTLSAQVCSDQNLQKVSIYPNPASMYLFINYKLASSVKVSISIWDLSGKIVAQNISSHIANQGENKESITLGDIPPGVYLLILTTDSGERSIQRLVITK